MFGQKNENKKFKVIGSNQATFLNLLYFTMGHFFGNFSYAFELKQIKIVVETVVQDLLTDLYHRSRCPRIVVNTLK